MLLLHKASGAQKLSRRSVVIPCVGYLNSKLAKPGSLQGTLTLHHQLIRPYTIETLIAIQ